VGDSLADLEPTIKKNKPLSESLTVFRVRLEMVTTTSTKVFLFFAVSVFASALITTATAQSPQASTTHRHSGAEECIHRSKTKEG